MWRGMIWSMDSFWSDLHNGQSGRFPRKAAHAENVLGGETT
jgi:hypothetical protein